MATDWGSAHDRVRWLQRATGRGVRRVLVISVTLANCWVNICPWLKVALSCLCPLSHPYAPAISTHYFHLPISDTCSPHISPICPHLLCVRYGCAIPSLPLRSPVLIPGFPCILCHCSNLASTALPLPFPFSCTFSLSLCLPPSHSCSLLPFSPLTFQIPPYASVPASSLSLVHSPFFFLPPSSRLSLSGHAFPSPCYVPISPHLLFLIHYTYPTSSFLFLFHTFLSLQLHLHLHLYRLSSFLLRCSCYGMLESERCDLNRVKMFFLSL